MIKLVHCIQRRGDVSPEEFSRYWLHEHGPLVRRYAEALRATRYVQSHTRRTPLDGAIRNGRAQAEGYDGLTEVWWHSMEDLVAALQTPEGQDANESLAAAEARFVDVSRSSVFLTEEYEIFAPPAQS